MQSTYCGRLTSNSTASGSSQVVFRGRQVRASVVSPGSTSFHRRCGLSRKANKGVEMGQPVVHFEVIGSDPNRLRDYYGELFGWTFGEPMGPSDYATVQDPDGIGGGIGGGP